MAKCTTLPTVIKDWWNQFKIGHLEISNNINYKAIGSVLSEIWIFEVNLRILSRIMTSMGCEGYDSPYTTSNWVKLILLEI